ncbi:hypothetical protein K450DRAFT_254396 [Umbelopsis ramanniana AG]|uniref:Uncharacterized protein n=1 Tax=Umbelopsis ramanniana AG TaxID=1314678 RepID=A0AAD5E403_UMBRA|nr:uncharacterized protein K450DRAFT_254396 [Umbelopsis ramanniana AG]KAI8576951.1 hypothetical protein K450DRAFT_254396 [Umbelopsis ramanniana AG]
MAFQTKNLRYLRLTNDTVLRVVLYIKDVHIPWYTDSKVHVSLQNIILKQLIGDNTKVQTKRKRGDKGLAEVFRGPNFQFAYYFTTQDTHHSIVHREPSYIFPESVEASDEGEEDQKPVLQVHYKGLSMYPEQLVLVVEPYDANGQPEFFGFHYRNTITKYLEAPASSSSATRSSE